MNHEHSPVWLDDTPEIKALLEHILDLLDKQPAEERRHPVGLTLNNKTIPALFDQGEAADQLWDLLRSLDEQHGVLRIRLKKQTDPFAPEYRQARLTLRDGGETALRVWLNRPQGLAPLQRWRKTVTLAAHHFPGRTDKLQAYNITVPRLDEAAVVQGFVDIQPYHRQSLSLRQLSSRCFRGDSKFLDKREELLRELYPDLLLSPRPVMVNIFIPQMAESVLFIENQDSYLQALSGTLAICHNHILVYVAGFRGSAARIRQHEGASLHYHSNSNLSLQTQLEKWWLQQEAKDWPVYFWGDLDYAGMGILKALKQRFSALQAWQPGYNHMLEQLQKGHGHAAAMVDKQAQMDPDTTGCLYADTVLLPAMREHQAFVDQETVF